MKNRILYLIASAVFFAGCSSVYKSSQTPDDVYYSPAREVKEAADARTDRYNDYTSSSEDNYLRMKIQNHYRWNSIDDFDYWYNPGYAYNNYYGGYNSFNPYISINPYVLNNWYSPYYYSSYSPGWFGSYYPSYGYGYGHYTPVYVIKNPVRNTTVARPALTGYSNRNYNNTNTNSNVRRQTLGSSMRRAFTPNNNNNTYNNNNRSNNNTSTDRPVRTYSPPPSSGGSSSSGSSGSVSRPPRH